jgi:hypothetical protein
MAGRDTLSTVSHRIDLHWARLACGARCALTFGIPAAVCDGSDVLLDRRRHADAGCWRDHGSRQPAQPTRLANTRGSQSRAACRPVFAGASSVNGSSPITVTASSDSLKNRPADVRARDGEVVRRDRFRPRVEHTACRQIMGCSFSNERDCRAVSGHRSATHVRFQSVLNYI